MRSMIFNFALVTLFMFSACSNAHYQSPIEIREISLNGSQLVTIKIGNDSNETRFFDIELNGGIISTNMKVGANKNRSFSTFIEEVEPSVVSKNLLCSISKPASGSYLRTRICTDVLILYPKEKIKALIENE